MGCCPTDSGSGSSRFLRAFSVFLADFCCPFLSAGSRGRLRRRRVSAARRKPAPDRAVGTTGSPANVQPHSGGGGTGASWFPEGVKRWLSGLRCPAQGRVFQSRTSVLLMRPLRGYSTVVLRGGTMVLIKTQAGQEALKNRHGRLSSRQRSAFILFDGKRSIDEVLGATVAMGITQGD